MVLYKYYMEIWVFFFLKNSFTKYQWWKNYVLVWLMEWLIVYVVVILFMIIYPFPLLFDTFLELKDFVKVPSLLSYHVCAHLIGELFTWVWMYFMKKSLFQLPMRMIVGVLNFLCRGTWHGVLWCSVCLLYQPWYPGYPRLLLSLHSWVLSLVVQMLLLSIYPVHKLYSHKFNLVSSCDTIISDKWRPMSWQGIALNMSVTTQWFRFFAGYSGTWMLWIWILPPSPSVHPSSVTFPFLYIIWCSSNWVFLLLSSDEVVVTYSYDIIPKNIAPLARFPITLFK